ncbi:MAG: Gfo/Idh/MocA family oxidoreductase [Planctomycetaceae bacterium]|nr:Gfo/Idh/MocA family oxidoreductase [Planctomycetaceae bacterium]
MNSTRRVFLKGAAAAPFVVSGMSWAAASAPRDRIRMGFIGMGVQSRGLMNMFLPRTQVVAVCDVDRTRREDARQKVEAYYKDHPDQGKPMCKAFVDFEELLAQPYVDAVCIATPDHWHAIQTLAALRAGKDVYCEKPLTHDIREAIDVMKEVGAQGRVLQTGSMQRSMREFRVACELARNGAIGKISLIECSFGDPAIPCDLPEEPMEPGLDWNRWVGPAPMRPYSSVLSPRGLHKHFPAWRNYKEFGGGMVCDWGAHHLDIAQWALGMDASGPVEVLPPAEADARRGAVLTYADGTQVIHKDGFGVHMFGELGEIRVNRGKFWFSLGEQTVAKWTDRQDQGTLESTLAKVEREHLKDAKVRLYKVEDSHVDDFLRCVQSRQRPITNEEVGARSAICCHLINLAYWHRQPMKWDPAQCAFREGTGDAKWIEHSYRDYKVS